VHGLIFTSFARYTNEVLSDLTAEIWSGRPAYEATSAYSDQEFADLIARTRELTGQTRREILTSLGAFTAEHVFTKLYPDYFVASGNTRSLLLSVEERIHEVVRATIPGAHPPRLHVRPFGRTGAMISYTSERRLCDLLEGLVLGTARHFGERLAVEHVQCMERGDVGCAVLVEPSTPDSSRSPPR
jgi:hypothetical protein